MSDWNQQIIDEFRANDGTVTTAGFGRNLVLVHHVGAKSGTERVTPLFALHPNADTWLLAASKAGAPEHPAWFHNLKAHPDVSIETPDDGTVKVHASVLEGTDRDKAYQGFKDAAEGFAEYEAKTTRVIPVIELRRA